MRVHARTFVGDFSENISTFAPKIHVGTFFYVLITSFKFLSLGILIDVSLTPVPGALGL